MIYAFLKVNKNITNKEEQLKWGNGKFGGVIRHGISHRYENIFSFVLCSLYNVCTWPELNFIHSFIHHYEFLAGSREKSWNILILACDLRDSSNDDCHTQRATIRRVRRSPIVMLNLNEKWWKKTYDSVGSYFPRKFAG